MTEELSVVTPPEAPAGAPPTNGDAKPRAEGEYGVDQMKYMSDMEHVRKRFGMYIGDKDVRGLHHLVFEVVDNSIDEAMGGFAHQITVTVNRDGSVSIADDGRGIPVDEDPSIGKSALEGVMTMLKYGGKFDKQAYKTSGGLHGIGVKAVNFLSEWCEVEVHRGGYIYQQEYERGKPTTPVLRTGTAGDTGTTTTFKPDPQVFGNLKFDYNILQKRLQEVAFLNRGVKIVLRDDRSDRTDVFQYQRGIVEFIEHLNRASDPAHPEVIYVQREEQGVEVEVAFQYSSEYTENVHSYVNNINTIDGGTHLTGFRTALTRTLNAYGKKNDLFKDLVPTGDDLREGLTAVVSLRVPEPQFESQTKVRCLNVELEGIVNSVVGDFLTTYFEENPKAARAIVKKATLAAEAREAARKAKQLLRERKGVMTGSGLPGKLRDCNSDNMEESELYLVEGDSAGGSAEGGRLREFQAILPLRGKIINAYKSREEKVLANEEIRSMIQAIGTNIGADFDISKLRYGKIVIMTDADVDGSHIRTLLLTFFYRQMYQLVSNGRVYIAQPPLFRVRVKKDTYYVQTEEEMKAQLMELGLADAVFEPGDGRTISGDAMKRLCHTLSALEESIVALERRGISLRAHVARQDPLTRRLPVFRVFLEGEEHWFTTRNQLDEFLAAHAGEGGAGGSSGSPPAAGERGPAPPRVHVIELHEVRSINSRLAELAEQGFDLSALLPQQRTGSQEPRYRLRRGEHVTPLEDLRGLPAAIRAAGEKGLTITRFKGLGEMNAEELRETTLDPAHRTLVRVTMGDAGDADNMFRVLMGDKVEPRREFIEQHALEAKLDV